MANSFSTLNNLTFLAVDSTPWVNRAYYSKHYFDDRYLDAIDYAQDESPLNEDSNVVAREFFSKCKPLQTLRILHHYTSDGYQVARKEEGTIDSVSATGDNEEWYGFPSLLGNSWW